MWKAKSSSRTGASGVVKIRRDTYNTHNGMAKKGGWWEIRALVRARSKGKCEAIIKGVRCSTLGVEVHHIIPLSKGGTNTLPNLLMLCMTCHNKRHRHLWVARGK